ncbi:MAG: hypothetical protein JWN24_2033 [Phycisphaerales bacterium]|jgi:uncharacterized protein (DUF983 family)|nr:hypothetical protein [Phycisphaerales bacterium]
MISRYWYDNCPECKQGRLFVMKESAQGNLFLLCEECESAWRSPEETVDLQKTFNITGLCFGFGNRENIARAGWSRYVLKEAKT